MFTKRFERLRSTTWACTVFQAILLCAALQVVERATAADKPGAADQRAIEQTIRRQLDAFVQDDADGAFRFATPDIRRLFGSSENFLHMVRENYEPVYRPGSVTFLRLEGVGADRVQTVQIVDGEGKVWRALFTMRRQADKSWKVGGCQLVQTTAIAT